MRALTALVVLALIAAHGLAQETAAPHVVMISIDGLRPEIYTKPGSASVVPTLTRLAGTGAFATGVVGVFPTVTYPSHTTLISGVPPALHGIHNNRILDPEGRSNDAWYWYARDITTTTLPGAIRARNLSTAAISWPVSIGMDADFLVPEYSRSGHPESLSLLRALAHPATLLDDLEAARGGALQWPLTDAARVEMAAWVLRAHRPHLLLLHIFETDAAQHEYGPASPQAVSALAAADRHVSQILDAIGEAGLRDRTTVVVVSDHGFLPLVQQLQLNAVFKREGWLRVDARGRVTGWDVYFQASGGSGFVFLKDPGNTQLRDRVWSLLGDLSKDAANGIQRLLSTEDLKALGADPRAAFAVDMRSGYYTGLAHDQLLAPAVSKGGHGNDPARQELHASLVMAGPNVPRAGNLGIVRMTQIAPTIAGWFGVSLSLNADKPLTLSVGTSR
jgi:predicted AlkP superfamily pyrophosphatase or phosphodiesterase